MSGDDERVLRAVGEHVGSLAGRDVAARCRAGAGPKHADRAVRKRALTAASSSRWAGAVTRVTGDQWERGRNNLWDERAQLRAAIRTIGLRVAAPVAGRAGRVKGYATGAERWHKQERRQVLQARLAGVEGDIAAGRVSIVRGGSHLVKVRHNLAAVFAMTDVVDVLVAAGARVRSIQEAAAAGQIAGWLTDDTPPQARLRALIMAADHERLDVIDALIAAGTPVDAQDDVYGRHPLRLAAANGRPASVRALLAHGADPTRRDAHGLTPLDHCRRSRVDAPDPSGYDEVEGLLNRSLRS